MNSLGLLRLFTLEQISVLQKASVKKNFRFLAQGVSFLVGLILLTNNVFATPIYFNYSPSSLLLTKDSILHIRMYYDLPESLLNRFIVKPIFTGGEMQVFNTDTVEWISSADLWTKFPKLAASMELKVLNTTNSMPILKFIILDLLTGVFYETPSVQFWEYSIYNSYIKAINENIKSFKTTKLEEFDKMD